MTLRYCVGTSPVTLRSAQATGNPEPVRPSTQATIDLAVAAEHVGIDSFWLSEDPDGGDALAVLGAIASRTSRIHLGTGVINPYFRHPSLIAASIATLDILSNGRAFIGLGRGQTEWYERALGMTIGRPVARLRETIDLLEQWEEAGEATSPPDATEFDVRGWERSVRPIQDHVPLYLAAVGPMAMRLAATAADGVIFNDLASPAFMQEQIGKVRSSLAESGRPGLDFRFFSRCQATVTDDPRPEWDRAKATVAMIHTLPGMERLLQSDIVDTEAMIADVRRIMQIDDVLAEGGSFPAIRRAGDLAAAKKRIPDALMEELTIAGSIEYVQVRLAELARIGVTDAFVRSPVAGMDLNTWSETVSRLVS